MELFTRSRITVLGVTLLFVVGCMSQTLCKAGKLYVNIGTPQGDIGKLGIEELGLYLDKMFTDEVELSVDNASAAIITGTPETNKLIAKAVKNGTLTLPDGKNADQGYTIKTIGRSIYVAGNTEKGLLYGIYELLEQYGGYFQITGDYLPDKTKFELKALDLRNSPVFKYRGLMPWDNFLCGMSGYNLEDSQLLIKQATRMKLNFLNLHFYPGYVMYNEVWDGKAVNPQWAAQPNEFAPKGKPGEKAFGDMELFCVQAWEDNKGNPQKQADACQQMFRDVIDYAHQHAWEVVAGFALMQPRGGDFEMTDKEGTPGTGGLNQINPLSEHNIEQSVKRYRRLTEIYPNADYYWMWQHEGGGPMCRNVGAEPGAAQMREKYSYWGDKNRAGDVDYAYLFMQVANRLSPQEQSKLATGGWGIQHIFPGIDKDFPKEVIFASLNDAYPQAAVPEMENYSVAKTGRRAWMISWWEFDGNQWFPQFRTSWHEKKYKKAYEFGVEGVSQLGWKLSAIEHHPRYLAEFAWNPQLSAKDFYRGYVRRIYGESAVDEITKLYEIYDEWETRTPPSTPADYRPMLLAAGWMAMAMPDVPFSREGLAAADWKETVRRAEDIIGRQQALMQEDLRSIDVLDKVIPGLTKSGESWAKLLKNRFEFRVLYVKATLALNKALVAYDLAGNVGGLKVGMDAAKKHSAKSLEYAAQAIEKYAADCRNRSDLGVIGQLNVQFYDVIDRFDAKFNLASPYVTIDWDSFRAAIAVKNDFTNPNCWPLRDGVASVKPFEDDNTPAIRLDLGNKDFNSSSLWIHQGPIALDEAPYMDFYIRTSSNEPLCFMFQVDGRNEWFELDILGSQGYTMVDKISAAEEINDGKWHRVTWNIKKVVKEKIAQDIGEIKHLIIGNWKSVSAPAVIELKKFELGQINKLDGLEVDNTR